MFHQLVYLFLNFFFFWNKYFKANPRHSNILLHILRPHVFNIIVPLQLMTNSTLSHIYDHSLILLNIRSTSIVHWVAQKCLFTSVWARALDFLEQDGKAFMWFRNQNLSHTSSWNPSHIAAAQSRTIRRQASLERLASEDETAGSHGQLGPAAFQSFSLQPVSESQRPELQHLQDLGHWEWLWVVRVSSCPPWYCLCFSGFDLSS